LPGKGYDRVAVDEAATLLVVSRIAVVTARRRSIVTTVEVWKKDY
jgi:hypothetical protein